MDLDILFYISSGVALVLIIVSALALWRIFEKAGVQGWYALVPVLNLLWLHKIADKPQWWVALYLVPLLNIYFAVVVINGLSKRFGKDESFTAGLFFLPLVFLPIIGFGEAQYQGMAEQSTANV